jgi:hypothetical protein
MTCLYHNLAKTSFFGTFLEPQMNADKRGFHGFLISVHLRPSAVPFFGCGFAALWIGVGFALFGGRSSGRRDAKALLTASFFWR